jgi:hypothetical protein
MEAWYGFGFIWSEDIKKEKKGQWAQEREIRVIWPLRNLKPLFVEEGNNLGGYKIKLR